MAWDDGLSPDQRTAASHANGNARLLAGPGTGKTKTLTGRVLFLIEVSGVEPRKIVALTFTRAAAFELRDRINKELAGKYADRPTVATLHSYALRNLLHNAARIDALPQPVRIADDWEERHIVLEDLKRLMGGETSVDDVRNKLRDLSADWNTLGIEGDPAQQKADAKFVGAWREHRGLYGYTLRDELVYELKRALQRRGDLELVPPTEHLLVDEYQDLNACDAAVIEAIRQRGAKVYGAGDDDQSIYGFRHALPVGIRSFLEKYAPAGDLKLEVCHRCDKAIIDLARYVAALDIHSLPKPLKPRDGAGDGEVLLLRFGDQSEEADGVASLCRHLIDNVQHKPDDILILLRNDRYSKFSKPLAAALKTAGVPYKLKVNDETPLDIDEGRTALSFLRLSLFKYDGLAWRTLLMVSQKGLGDGAFRALYDTARAAGVSVGQLLTEKDLTGIPRFGAKLQAARTGILQQLLAAGAMLEAPTDGSPVPPLFERVTGVFNAVVKDADECAKMLEYVKMVITESDATTAAELLQALSAADSETEQAIVPGAVNILTMHRAKGLTARTVIVVAAEDEYIPGRQEGTPAEDDERRLLYVSLSRARERLVVTYTDQRTGEQRHTGRTSGEKIRNLTRYLQDAPVEPKNGNTYVQKLGQ